MADPVFIIEKGVELYLDNEMVKIVNNEIKHLGLKNVQAFLAIHPDGDKEYLLVKDGKPYRASQKVEDIGNYIEILALIEKYENSEKDQK